MGFSTIGGAGGGSAETPSGGAGSADHAGVEDNSSSNADQIQINDASVVINKDGDDCDFVVEGDTEPHLLYCDASTERVGFGTPSPDAQVEVVKAAADAEVAISCYHDTEATTAKLTFRKADNTEASPALVDRSAVLGTVSFQGYDGNSWEEGAKIFARVPSSGTLVPSDGDMPTELIFATENGASAPTQYMILQSNGDLLLQNQDEDERGIILADNGAPLTQYAKLQFDSGGYSGQTAGFSIMTSGGGQPPGTSGTLTGSINVTASTTVNGSGTEFTTECIVGDNLRITDPTTGAVEVRTINAITSNTVLTVSQAFTNLGDDSTVELERRAMQISGAGDIGMGVKPATAGEKLALNGSMAFLEQSAAPSATADYCKIVALEDGIDATTVLMLHGDGSDGGTTITDSSTATTKTCTAVNQTHTDTTVKLYGTAAIQFDGTADYITVPDHADFNMAAGDFTYEFWVRFDAIPDDCGFFGQTQSTGTGGDTYEKGMYCYHEGGDGRIYFRWRSHTTSARRIDVSYLANLQANSWYHMAWVRNGPIITPYLNGRAQDHAEHAHSPTQDDIQVGADTLVDCDGVLEIGKGNAFSMVAGYMEEFRITKGVAKYTSDFTPPGSAFPITRLYAVNSAGGKTMIG